MIIEGTITAIESAHEDQGFEKYILVGSGQNEIGIQVRRKLIKALPPLSIGDTFKGQVKFIHQSQHNPKRGLTYHHNNIILEHLIN